MVDLNVASPKAVKYGVKDESARQLPVSPPSNAQLIPYIWTLAEKGPEEQLVASGTEASLIFGKDTFSLNSKYTTHQTTAADVTFAAGGGAYIRRIKPSGGKTATVNFYAETIPSLIGSTVANRVMLHNTLPVAPASTSEVVTDYRTGDTAIDADNTAPDATIGYLGNDGTDNYSVSSTLFHLVSAEAVYFGEYYNRFSFRLLATANKRGDASALNLSNQLGHYVYSLQVLATDPFTKKVSIVNSVSGDSVTQVVLAEGITHPDYGTPMSLGDVLTSAYNVFSNVTVNYGAIAQLQEALLGGNTVTDDNGNNYQIPVADVEANLINLINGTSTENVKTPSYTVYGGTVDPASGFALSGGDDGIPQLGETIQDLRVDSRLRTVINTMMLEYAVLADVEAMSLGTSEYLDRARFPFRDIVDTGFSLPTKLKLGIYSGLCKDINTWSTTFEFLYGFQPEAYAPAPLDAGELQAMTDALEAEGFSDEEILAKVTAVQNSGFPSNIGDYDLGLVAYTKNIGQESGTLAAIKASFDDYAESEEYGTPAMRYSIQQQSGKQPATTYAYPVPLMLETFGNFVRYMGAANGSWNSANSPDASPNNVLKTFDVKSVNVIYRPQPVYDKDYQNGAIWAQSYSTTQLFTPVLRTIYPDNTSVLNSLITSKACATLEVIADSVWRDLVGNSKLTDEQFLQRSDEFIAERCNDKFDNRFIIEPVTFYTGADATRGFTWSCNINIYCNVMKTVGVYSIEARRRSDYNPGGN